MGLRCESCGDPAVPGQPDPPWCARCWARYAEYQRRWDEVQSAGGTWNASQDDPWWREWLTSWELFSTYHDAAPRLGERLLGMLGGDVYKFGLEECWVQVWVSLTEVVVAYPPYGERYGFRSHDEGFHEFEGWVHHLRHSERLELGKVRGRSSYGPACPGGKTALPAVKWAQAGDWAALARNWDWGVRRSR
jgi:hypothetical protein